MIEFDFLPVGNGSKSGDAIAGRFIDAQGRLQVFIIDGGYSTDGDALVEFVTSRYEVDTVDLVISTHPDQNHLSGLFKVVSRLKVRTLLLPQPSKFGYRGDSSVHAPEADRLASEATAYSPRVEIIAPFEGQEYFGGLLRIAGPSESYYLECLSDGTSKSKAIELAVKHALAAGAGQVEKLLSTVFEPPEKPLSDNGGTTPANNSSVICDFRVDGYRALLTGDAGVPALQRAHTHLASTGRADRLPDLFLIPHHASRHNLNDATLDSLIGGRYLENGNLTAVASISAEAEGYPRPEVSNSMKRRGYSVHTTAGSCFWWSKNSYSRSDYAAATPMPWLVEQ